MFSNENGETNVWLVLIVVFIALAVFGVISVGR